MSESKLVSWFASGVCALVFCIGISAPRAHAFSFTPNGIGVLPDGKLAESYELSFDPDESFPWHFHPGTLNVIVTQGTLTEDRGCGQPLLVHNAGSAFQEPPGVVHMVTNNGSQTVVLQISGVIPSCFNNYNDDVEVGGPDCSGSSTHAQIEKVPRCTYLAQHCTIDPNLGGFICTPEP